MNLMEEFPDFWKFWEEMIPASVMLHTERIRRKESLSINFFPN